MKKKPLLDRYRTLRDAIALLLEQQEILIQEMTQAGLRWEEMAFVDKLAAVKLLMKSDGLKIRAAYDKVNEFLQTHK